MEAQSPRSLGLPSVVVLGLAVFCVSLLALMPASFALRWLPLSSVGSEQLQVLDSAGTVWRGQLQLQSGQEVVNASWQLSPLSLLLFSPSVAISVTTDDLSLSGQLQWLAGDLALNEVNGQISAATINRVLSQFGAHIESGVQIKAVSVAQDNNRWTQASGKVLWAGGEVSYPVGRKRQSSTVPPLVATLQPFESGVQALVMGQEAGSPLLAELSLEQDVDKVGLLSLKILRATADLLRLPMGRSRSDVIFEWSRELD